MENPPSSDRPNPEPRPAGAPAAPSTPEKSGGFLSKLGLDRRELRAWAMYDFGNSAFMTIIITAIFPIYYSRVASTGIPNETSEFRFSMATTGAMIVIAILAPILGALADFSPIKKRMIAVFLSMGVISVATMFFIQRGNWISALVLFVIANFGANGSFVFYDSLLPHLASDEEMDRVSTAGYALGYIGGGLLLALNLAWIMQPGWFGLPSGPNLSESDATLPTRLAFLSVAVWWALFSIPLFRRVPEPPVRLESDESKGQSPIKAAFIRLGETFRELKKFKNAFLMLLAFLIYNDGIGTIIRMATLYGAGIGLKENDMIAAVLLTQFVGVPFAFAFGALAGKIGAKRSIFLALVVYTGISIIGYYMKTATHFLVLAILVGMVQGGAQALSRSLFASLIPRHKAGEFFGFFAVVEKFAGIMGPLVFGAVIAISGSSRGAILSVIAFFFVGGFILLFVNVAEGQRIARAADQDALPV
ncbi:MAG: MFS transporter [Limisphaerales bacterium]